MLQKTKERLKELRKNAGFTQVEVSTSLEIKNRTYQSYEEGRAHPPRSVLVSLTLLYGFTTVDEMLGMLPDKRTSLERKYAALRPDKKRIVDFILNGK